PRKRGLTPLRGDRLIWVPPALPPGQRPAPGRRHQPAPPPAQRPRQAAASAPHQGAVSAPRRPRISAPAPPPRAPAPPPPSPAPRAASASAPRPPPRTPRRVIVPLVPLGDRSVRLHHRRRRQRGLRPGGAPVRRLQRQRPASRGRTGRRRRRDPRP